MEKAQLILKAIIDSLQDAVSVVNEEGLGIMFNKAYYELTGLEEKDVMHKPAHVDIAEGESIHMKVLQTGKAIKNVPMKVGPYKRDVVVSCAPIYINGTLKGSVGIIHDVSEIRTLLDELHHARQKMRHLEAKYTFDDIVGTSPVLQEAIKAAKVVAATPVNVLLRGDCGTGKELFAHAIHEASTRRDQQFIRVNLNAIPETLLESELFGYSEGAFTGARKKGKKGFFEEAHGGTLFLDEISSMSMNLQVKLLRALQEKEILRLGESKAIPVDVRIIAATNADLEELIEKGRFRKDLYYRLNVFPIVIPPLWKRKEDIPVLVQHFLQVLSKEYGRQGIKISSRALQRLMEYDWPGNVRELKNVIARAMIILERHEKVIEEKHLMLTPVHHQEAVGGGSWEYNFDGESLGELKARFEKEVIRAALEEAGGNKTEAARKLKISIRNLYNKINQYGLE